MAGCHFERQPEPRMASLRDGENSVMSYYKFANNFVKHSQGIHILLLRHATRLLRNVNPNLFHNKTNVFVQKTKDLHYSNYTTVVQVLFS